MHKHTMTSTKGQADDQLMALLIAIVFISVVGLACQRTPVSSGDRGAGMPIAESLRRSGNTSWEVKQSTRTGIQVETPTDLCGFTDEPTLGMAILMHTLPPPSGVLDDKKCLLEMRIERMKRETFERERMVVTGRYKDDPSWKWMHTRHDSIDRRNEGQYTLFRYDLDCPNGDVIYTLTNVTNVYERGASLYDTQDEAIVRRILGSLRCLDPRS